MGKLKKRVGNRVWEKKNVNEKREENGEGN